MDKDLMYSQLLGEQIRQYRQNNNWLGFKTDFEDVASLGRYISALSNGACLAHKDFGYLYFGVDENTLKVIGTTFDASERGPEGDQSLELWLRQKLTPCIYFKIETFMYNGSTRIVRLKIPYAQSEPTRFGGWAYILIGGKIERLELYAEWMREIYTSSYDWTAKVIDGATMDDLDKDAIELAREGYKKHYPELAKECDKWSDEVFLDKAWLTQGGKITRTTLLLVGKEEVSYKLNPIPQIVWKCFKDGEIFGEIYTIPFVCTTKELLRRIHNQRFKIFPHNTFIKSEVWKYDQRSLIESLHNCLVHMDYTRDESVVVTESRDDLTFESPGGFYKGKLEDYIKGSKIPECYRNTTLMEAMVKINMIDSLGYGINNLYARQKERCLPMPDYDESTDSKVVLHLPGKVIDENYSFLLLSNPKVTLEEAVLLDKVQKGKKIPDEAIMLLRKKHLIEGRKPNLHVVRQYTQ